MLSDSRDMESSSGIILGKATVDFYNGLWDSYRNQVLGITGNGSSNNINGESGANNGGNNLDEEELKKRFRKAIFESNPNDDPYTANRRSALKLKDSIEEAEKAYNAYIDAVNDPNNQENWKDKLEKFKAFNDKRAQMQWAFERKVRTFRGLNYNIESTKDVFKEFGKQVDDLTNSWGKADQAAANYAKSVAMSAKGMAALRDNTINNVVHSKIGIRFDTSADELLKMQQNYVDNIGRNIGVSNEGQENMAAMNKVMGDRGNDMIVKLENFGLSINDAAERSGKMFSTASKYGLDFSKYSKNFLDNITIAQNYTFKNGLKGLEEMAKKATAIKLDMKQVAQFAEKVQTVEGAMDAASKLQVLGGSFSQLADPLGMLNEGLNDMEGLMDRVTGMIRGMGTVNKQTGEVEVSSFNKQRIRAAASAMGMSYDSLMNSVNAGTRREEIDRQLRVSGKSGLSDEMKELIRNTGTIQNGVAGVNINGEFRKLSELSNNDYTELVKQGQSDSENIKDIATMLRGMTDVRSGSKKQREAFEAKHMGWLGKISKEFHNVVGTTNVILGVMLAGKILKGGFQLAGKGYGTFGRMIFQGKFKRAGRSIIKKLKNGILPGGAGAGAAPMASTATGTLGRTLANAPKGNAFYRTLPGGVRVENSIERTAQRRILKTFGRGKVGNALTNAVGKGRGGKVLAKYLANPKLTIGNVAKGVGAGTAVSLAGAALQGWRDARVESGKGKKGDTTDRWMTWGSSTLKYAGIGTSIGSMIAPGIGTAVGAAIGAVTGTVVGICQNGKRKAEANLENALSVKGLEAHGKYSKKEMKKITASLATGKIDDETKAKLIGQGDSAILDEIDRRRIKEAKIAAIGKTMVINNQNVTAAVSPSSRKKSGDNEKEKVQITVVTASKSNVGNGMTLSSVGQKGNGGVEPQGPIAVMPMKNNGNGEVSSSTAPKKDTEKPKPQDINININGRLKLEGAGGKDVDVTKELMAALKNPSFIKTTLIPIIMKGLNESKYGTNVPSGINRYAIA